MAKLLKLLIRMLINELLYKRLLIIHHRAESMVRSPDPGHRAGKEMSAEKN